MDNVLKGGLGLTIALVALVACNGAGDPQERPVSRDPPAAQAAKQMDELRARASREHPDLVPTEALRQVVSDDTEMKMAAQESDQRLFTAASIFWGFYFVNTKTRVDYCDERNVDLTPFVQAFTKEHARDHSAAEAVFRKAGMDPNTLVEQVGSELRKNVDQDMIDLATNEQVPVDQTCSLLNEHAEEFAKIIQLPPHVKQALITSN